ncbi:Uncharacterised protein [Vibrio cholerae]|nr:Uncharacterised protein [Vibrio cholerae]
MNAKFLCGRHKRLAFVGGYIGNQYRIHASFLAALIKIVDAACVNQVGIHQ